MTVGGYQMPEPDEADALTAARMDLIPGLPERCIDIYSKAAEGYSGDQIRRHNTAVQKIDAIARGESAPD